MSKHRIGNKKELTSRQPLYLIGEGNKRREEVFGYRCARVVYQRANEAISCVKEDCEDQPDIVQCWFRCTRIRICNIVHLHNLK